MDEKETVVVPKQEKKKRRTAEEIAADKLKREQEVQAAATEAKNNIATWEKEIAEKQTKIKAAKEKLKASRNTIRNHHGMIIYGDVVNMIGLGDTEKACYTNEDFEDLRNLVINRVKTLLNAEKRNAKKDVPEEKVGPEDTVKKE